MITEQVLIVDIETNTPSGKPDPDRDIIKYIGIRLPNGVKHVFSHPQHKDKCQKLLDRYRYIANHNWKGYDLPIMIRHGYRFKNKVHIDTLEIIEKRAKSMMYLDFGMGQKNLKYLCEFFGLSIQKGDFDYALLRKPFLTASEYRYLKEYLFLDLDSTFGLFEHLYDFFSGFKELVSKQDVMNFKWLTSSAGAVVYKLICHNAKLPELYGDGKGVKYDGGFVSQPYIDFIDGDLYCVDWKSLYPHMFMGGNLYSPTDNVGDGVWSGNELFPVKGNYKTDMGVIEKVIQNLYSSRVADKKLMKTVKYGTPEYKNLDRRQLAKKIAINTAYGISGSALFLSVYNRTTASDCTLMARCSILNARDTLTKEGYECLYTDTDSVYLKDPYNDKARLLAVCKRISEYQISQLNINIDTHDLELETDIARMYFFRNDMGQFTKKHYIYITKEGKLTIKGLKPVRGDCSIVAKTIFNTIISNDLKNGRESQYYTVSEIQKHIIDLSLKEPDVLKKRYRVYDPKTYKSKTSIQHQIAVKYGPGEHYLIPNKFIGVGKGARYATLEELKTAFGDKWLKAVSIDRYVKDLSEFIKPKERKTIGRIQNKSLFDF